MAISDILKDIAPEFDATDPAKVLRFITYAENQVSADIFKIDYELAVAYLTAHMLALASRNAAEGSGGLGGNITSKKEGDLQVQYALSLIHI